MLGFQKLLFLWLWLCVSHVMAATIADREPLDLHHSTQFQLGDSAQIWHEQAERLNLAQAQALQQKGEFQPSQQQVLNFGIGTRPVWIHLAVSNPSQAHSIMRLTTGATWLDQIDVYLVHNGELKAFWRSGDTVSGVPGLLPSIGFTFFPEFAPGRSELYLRVASLDPMMLPMSLQTIPQAAQADLTIYYRSGAFYGFLSALCLFNFMLFVGLGSRSQLYYAAYLLSLMALSWAYNGYGNAWLWPDSMGLQRYVILVLMVLYSSIGLIFASRFLSLAEHSLRIYRGVQALITVAILAMLVAILMQSQLGALWIAFTFMLVFTLLIVYLGVVTVQRGRMEGRYFLAAALCGMVGIAITTLAVLGWIPMRNWTYHALEVGVMIEATLFALALAYRVRNQQRVGLEAEYLARYDSLTNLCNRRAFHELAARLWSTAERSERPLSVIMFDIDFFKTVNDDYGHAVGDQALQLVAQHLQQSSRVGDVLARWGGEEFILLLPETSVAEAVILAERIRLLIANAVMPFEKGELTLTVSAGVAERVAEISIEKLIAKADDLLYTAKKNGRNQVQS